MTACFQGKLPEEIELEQKKAELASLRARHAELSAELQQLREEIAGFEKNYQATLGLRMAELERLEAEIARLCGGGAVSDPEIQEEYLDRETYGRGKSFKPGAGAGSRGRVWKAEEEDIKALYREVAKAIHPDLAGEGNRSLRHELMLKANQAYADEDSRALREILRSWRRHHPERQPEAPDVKTELARVKREIAVEAQAVRDLSAQVENLRTSYVCRFKLRVDQSLAEGSDLFAEMIAAAEMNVARAQRRLAALRSEKAREAAGRTRVRRSIQFPDGLSCGTLYFRDLASADFSQWKKAGPAAGRVDVYVDQAVRLDVKDEAGPSLKLLQQLKADDLQALFLYEVTDSDLDNIVHLSGLEELYLCGQGLTDAALLSISSLTNLKRIYLYQTAISDRGLVYLQGLQGLKGLTSSGNSITDEGLAVFQKAIPGVKTVSFKWKR
ncbi:molecular chaperone DnaJ [Geoanaerobacter pelophilus]|uniref:Molecular chaperone DnaJ n=1 Tax=Geoanaerobacter pelophilus TaxID=60036 RepID=A0ABQ0MGU2_9BACT|nr:molecular chaperone DnaJ [Geoanaerobacter pelophilus]GAW66303.1 molecular chaperone DnaJ [Geoanaerobacter pelophilus]